MKYVEAPTKWDYRVEDGSCSLFLAGGITDCPDWQSDVLHKLAQLRHSSQLTVLNPRRKNFPIHNPDAATAQIEWEHFHLEAAHAILFWFPCETLCPIALYELGAWSMTQKRLFVGCHPDYKRKADVVIQTQLRRPNVHVVFSLDDLVTKVEDWA